jgi:hypothetical protein
VAVGADYVVSWASIYRDQVSRTWLEVVGDVRHQVQAAINHDGAFIASGDPGELTRMPGGVPGSFLSYSGKTSPAGD